MEQNKFTAILVYVDDFLITGNDIDYINNLKEKLNESFPIKDLGDAKYFLGIEIFRSKRGIYLNQRKYILDIIDDMGLMGCKPSNTPMQRGCKTQLTPNEEAIDPEIYRRLIGRLLYLSLTRPDLSFCVQQLSQFMVNPTKQQYEAAIQIVKYLKGTPSLGLFYKANQEPIVKAYSDSDWATSPISRKSVTGYCVFIGESPISWKTKKQTVVSRSSAEAEYRSLANTVCELKWISYILRDLNIKVELPIQLMCDNQSAIHITKNPIFHERTKHIEIDCHLVRNQYTSGFIELQYLNTKQQIADIFTKPIEGAQFANLRSALFLQDIHLEEGMIK